jgi:hypothetical protein
LPAVAYDLESEAGIVRSRERVSAWLASALASADLAPAAMGPLVSPPRRQYPKLPFIIVTTIFFAGLLGTLATESLQRYFARVRESGAEHQLRQTPR